MEGGTGNHMRASTPIDIPAECPLEEYIENKDEGKSKLFLCRDTIYGRVCIYRSPLGECKYPRGDCSYAWLEK